MSINDLPLRERKHALTKFALLDVVITKLRDKPLAEISVAKICKIVPISEVTFYNYFSKKSDLINYFMQLWSIDLLWHIKKRNIEEGLGLIEEILEFTANTVEEIPNVMAEIIIMVAQNRNEIKFQLLSHAEHLIYSKKHSYPEIIPERNLDAIIIPSLQIASEQGNLPKDVDVNAVYHSILSILYGVPIAILYTTSSDTSQKIRSQYRKQIRNLWQILGLTNDFIS